MITLHVEAGSVDELREKAVRELGLLTAPTRIEKSAVTPAVPAGAPTQTEEKRKPGRPLKAETPPPPPPAAAAEPNGKAYTLEQVRTALQGYATKVGGGDQNVGIMKVRELLATCQDVHGKPCEKISQVQVQDYPGLVAKCAV